MTREERADEFDQKLNKLVFEIYDLVKDEYPSECDDGWCDNEECVVWKAVEQYVKYSPRVRDEKINEILTPDDIKKSWITSEDTSEVDGFPVGTWMIEFEPKIN
jgi:hypothetical protein